MMWELWRAEIDRSLRDAELARDRWYEHGFRAELRRDPGTALQQFRLVSEPPSLAATPALARRASWWERTFGRTLPRQAR